MYQHNIMVLWVMNFDCDSGNKLFKSHCDDLHLSLDNSLRNSNVTVIPV